MKTIIIILTILTIISAFLCIQGKYNGKRIQVYIFKPLTTVLILFIAIIASRLCEGAIKYYIFIALLFSLGGDIFLMLPNNKFLYGLISFLIAHIFLILGFFNLNKEIHWQIVIIFVLIGTILYIILYPNLKKMKWPVLAYLIVISIMGWRAWENYYFFESIPMLLLAVGSTIFMVSDANIAFDKFKSPYKYAQLIILSTYYFSIYLISISLLYL
jgi:uncharacterized membrane protein YhhN